MSAGEDGFSVSRLNAEQWFGRGLALQFRDLPLREAESGLLARHREVLSGRVFQLGCGAGRLTVPLGRIARELVAVDGSPAMVELCRQRVPQATISLEDLQELGRFEAGGFDAVVAGFNMVDVYSDAERRDLLRALHRLLAPEGLFLFSSHNLGFAPRFGNAWHLLLGRPKTPLSSLRALPSRFRNRRRLKPREVWTPDYAIVNDASNDFGMMHYFIARDAQEQQLAACGFELLDCRDLQDRPVPRGETAPRCPELHYVARPLAT